MSRLTRHAHGALRIEDPACLLGKNLQQVKPLSAAEILELRLSQHDTIRTPVRKSRSLPMALAQGFGVRKDLLIAVVRL